MGQKVCEITMTVVALEEDAEQVKESFDAWFEGNDVALYRNSDRTLVSGPRLPTPNERVVFLLDEEDEQTEETNEST